MGVVAASVHGAGGLRGEGEAGVLDQGQGVHVAGATGRCARWLGRAGSPPGRWSSGPRESPEADRPRPPSPWPWSWEGRGRARVRRGSRGEGRWRRRAGSPAAVQAWRSKATAFMAGSRLAGDRVPPCTPPGAPSPWLCQGRARVLRAAHEQAPIPLAFPVRDLAEARRLQRRPAGAVRKADPTRTGWILISTVTRSSPT